MLSGIMTRANERQKCITQCGIQSEASEQKEIGLGS